MIGSRGNPVLLRLAARNLQVLVAKPHDGENCAAPVGFDDRIDARIEPRADERLDAGVDDGRELLEHDFARPGGNDDLGWIDSQERSCARLRLRHDPRRTIGVGSWGSRKAVERKLAIGAACSSRLALARATKSSRIAEPGVL